MVKELFYKLLILLFFPIIAINLVYDFSLKILINVILFSATLFLMRFLLNFFYPSQKIRIIFFSFLSIICISFYLFSFNYLSKFLFLFSVSYIFTDILIFCLELLRVKFKNISIITLLLFLFLILHQFYLSKYIIYELFVLISTFILFSLFQLRNFFSHKKVKGQIQETQENSFDFLDRKETINFRDLAQLWMPDSEKQNERKQQNITINEGLQKKKKGEKVLKFPLHLVENKEKQQNQQEKLELFEMQKGEIARGDEERIKFKNKYVKKIYNLFVKDKIKSNSFLKVIRCLLSFLDEGGEDPSISNRDKETESNFSDFLNSYDIFAKISLAEHTYNVLNEMLKLVQENFQDTWEITWPMALIVGLAHDLGKSSTLNGMVPMYYGSHANISSELLLQCAGDLSKDTAKILSMTVAYHHGKVPDNFPNEKLLNLLKNADSLARKKEMKEKLGETQSWKEIKVSNFARILYNLLESVTKEGGYKNYPYTVNLEKGLLFINPDLFLTCLKKVIEEKNIYWPEFMSRDSTEKARAVKQFITAKLSPAGWLPSGYIAPGRNQYFKMFPVEINGKGYGKRPFIPFILNSVCKSAGHEGFELIQLWQDSFLKELFIIV